MGKLAEKYTEDLDSIQYLTWHHDVGFMIGSSYLNGYLLGKKEYKNVIVQTAKALSTRFRPTAGVIQSWNVDRGWQSQRGWECPVIIDNMMNLELLFEATTLSGDSTFYNIAVAHANTTLKNHFRKDNSCCHVVDYDLSNGEVRKNKLHKVMQMSLYGLEDKLGPFTVTPFVTDIHTIHAIWSKRKKYTILSSTILNCLQTLYLIGITMHLIYLMNHVMLLLPL